MELALTQARQALSAGEFPVGCVLVGGGREVARGGRKFSFGASLIEIDHAEMVALRNLQASQWRADGSALTLYSTMEPCLMCLAALMLNGVGTIVYAFEDVMGGATALAPESLPTLYRERWPRIIPHIRRGESLALFQQFFRNPDNGYWRDSPLARYTLDQPCP